MTTFTASDGTIITYDTLPTLVCVAELFNFVYEQQVQPQREMMIALESKAALRVDFINLRHFGGGRATHEGPPEDAPGKGAAGEPSGSK